MYREKLAMMKNTYRTIYGAIAGDIIGSMYEFRSVKSKDFELFPYGACFTDDTVMTLAIARWLMEDVTRSEYTLVDTMCEFGNRYPAVGYGGLFCNWLCNDPTPYNSWGNGSAMRVSAVGLVAKTLDECLRLAKQTAAVSHNHPEAIKGAQAVAASIFIALHWTGEIDELKVYIRDFVTNQFEYNMNRTLNEIRPRYEFDVSCQGSVPEAIIAFLEADSYEDAIRNAVSLGGDADTQGAIAGAIAACVYPISEYIIKECQRRLSDDLLKVVIRFEDYLDNEWQNKISLPCSCLQPKRETVEPEKYVDIIRDNIDLIHKSIKIAVVMVAFILVKILWVYWSCTDNGTWEDEKGELIQRRDFLIDRVVTSPRALLCEMPEGIGTQFQGEWALYSCSMLAAALFNMSKLYPETKTENLENIDNLIEMVLSFELRKYDAERWGEDPLETLDGDRSHISYITHLAWMISEYKMAGGNDKYNNLFDDLCGTMNRRLLRSKSLNLPTYPNECIYVPDMLVAIVALNNYSKLNKGKYISTVRKWVRKAKSEWLDKETGLLVSFLSEDGIPFKAAPVKGSYSALNCLYLTQIDSVFAREQYHRLKSHFLQSGLLFGIREYHDYSCWLGFDIDAGPVLFNLSPSGTAFAVGSATYFNDVRVRNNFLRTAEIAGHSVMWNNTRHYLLAEIALVGECIMLAMRTTTP